MIELYEEGDPANKPHEEEDGTSSDDDDILYGFLDKLRTRSKHTRLKDMLDLGEMSWNRPRKSIWAG